MENPQQKLKASRSPKKKPSININNRESIIGSNTGSQEHFLNQNVTIFSTANKKNSSKKTLSNEASPSHAKEPMAQESPTIQTEGQ